RREHANKQRAPLLTLAQARANAQRISHAPVKPNKLGITALNLDLAAIAHYIDWNPFFLTWDLAGKYPRVFDDARIGEQAKQVFADAQAMLQKIIAEKWLTARAAFGLFEANAIGDDIEFRDGEKALLTWRGLRQQVTLSDGKANQCLADFVAPKSSGITDYAGAFAVTTGLGIEKKLAEFEAAHDDYNAIMLKALADRLAEAAAEWLHERVRKEYWGYAPAESFSHQELIAESYQGIRPAPGYPACPDHLVKRDLFRLLGASTRCGMSLTESMAMAPAASVAGFYLAQGHYFAINRIGRDQLEDWAKRSAIPTPEAEKWLAHLL
ncbi:MAG: methionine synthase, partial [Zoogloeaceae bacterium]|nr:methionine synthase [Zoogloeaceae bacterium]